MTGSQPYPAYRDAGVDAGTGGGGDSGWAAMWEGPVPWVTGPLVVRERSVRDVKLCVDAQFRGPSRRLIERAERGEVTLVVSEATLGELEPSPKAVRDVFDAIGAENVEVMEATEEIRELAKRYIEAGAITAKSRKDAEHIAAATVAGVSVVASWNFRHMVNFRRSQRYNDVNRDAGYAPIDIRSPREIQNEE